MGTHDGFPMFLTDDSKDLYDIITNGIIKKDKM